MARASRSTPKGEKMIDAGFRIAVAAAALVATSTTSLAQMIPEQIKGTWCYVEDIDNHGEKVQVFRRGPCSGNTAVVRTYAARSSTVRIGRSSSSCRMKSVKPNDGRIGWFFTFACGGDDIDEFVYPMTGGRLGVAVTDIRQ